jgi:hypothetical protein
MAMAMAMAMAVAMAITGRGLALHSLHCRVPLSILRPWFLSVRIQFPCPCPRPHPRPCPRPHLALALALALALTLALALALGLLECSSTMLIESIFDLLYSSHHSFIIPIALTLLIPFFLISTRPHYPFGYLPSPRIFPSIH